MLNTTTTEASHLRNIVQLPWGKSVPINGSQNVQESTTAFNYRLEASLVRHQSLMTSGSWKSGFINISGHESRVAKSQSGNTVELPCPCLLFIKTACRLTASFRWRSHRDNTTGQGKVCIAATAPSRDSVKDSSGSSQVPAGSLKARRMGAHRSQPFRASCQDAHRHPATTVSEM